MPLGIYILAWILYSFLFFDDLPYYYDIILGIIPRFSEDFSTKTFLYISGAFLLVYVYLIFKNLKTVKAWDDINQTKDDLNIPNPHKDSWSNEELLHIRYSTIGIIMVVVGIIIHFLLL